MSTLTAPQPTALLPAEAYWSPRWYEREQQRLFGATWHLVCRTDELARVGDAVTVEAGTERLLVLRDGDGTLRAFHNRCPHRGMRLLDGAGNVASGIVCPYHAWSFALDGRCRRIPQAEQFPTATPDTCCLDEASVGVWAGLVFAHPEPGGSLEAYLDAVPTLIGSFRPERLTQVARFEVPARCNWKLLVENHVDVYHLWYLHARTLSEYDHHRFAWRQVGPHWTSYEPRRPGVAARRPHAGAPQIRHLDDRDRAGIGAHLVFPNLLMAAEAEMFLTYVARPVAPDRTSLDVRVHAEADAPPEPLVAAARAFLLEDVAACEAVQDTVRSRRFRVAHLAVDHERPITEFHRRVLAALGEGGDRGDP